MCAYKTYYLLKHIIQSTFNPALRSRCVISHSRQSAAFFFLPHTPADSHFQWPGHSHSTFVSSCVLCLSENECMYGCVGLTRRCKCIVSDNWWNRRYVSNEVARWSSTRPILTRASHASAMMMITMHTLDLSVFVSLLCVLVWMPYSHLLRRHRHVGRVAFCSRFPSTHRRQGGGRWCVLFFCSFVWTLLAFCRSVTLFSCHHSRIYYFHFHIALHT